MRSLKTGIHWAKVEALLGTLAVTVLAVLPAIENADWKSTAGCMSGALAVAGIVGVRLLGHQKWDKLVADRGPHIAADLIRAGEIVKNGLPIPASVPSPANPAEVAGLSALASTVGDISEDVSPVAESTRISLDDQLGFAEHAVTLDIPGDEPVDPDTGDSRSAAAKAAA